MWSLVASEHLAPRFWNPKYATAYTSSYKRIRPATFTFPQADTQSSILLWSTCPNHLILPCLTTSATLWMPKRLYKSSLSIPQWHFTHPSHHHMLCPLQTSLSQENLKEQPVNFNCFANGSELLPQSWIRNSFELILFLQSLRFAEAVDRFEIQIAEGIPPSPFIQLYPAPLCHRHPIGGKYFRWHVRTDFSISEAHPTMHRMGSTETGNWSHDLWS